MPIVATQNAATRTMGIAPSTSDPPGTPASAAPVAIASITAIPPPWGVGTECDDRAFGRANA